MFASSIRTESIEITSEILRLIAAIDQFKGAWREMGDLAPDRLFALRRVATVESVGSSTRIEGSRLSDSDVELLLAHIEAKSFASRDEQEVAGYADTMETVFQSWAEMPLSENLVKQLHRDVLRFSEKDERHRGAYKTQANSVAMFDANGTQLGIIFETATPLETPQRMEALLRWLRDEFAAGELHPLLVVGVFTLVFLAIHPFQDGNGRLSRILTTMLLLKAGYGYVPYSSLESVIEANKDGYYRALRRTQAKLDTDAPDWEPWLRFFLTALLRQTQQLEAKLAADRTARQVSPAWSWRILAQARGQGRVTMGEMLRVTGGKRNTLKPHFRRLVAEGRLARHGTGKGAWYTPA